MRILRLASVSVALLAVLASPAAALELLDRIIDFTGDTIRDVRKDGDSPPALRVGLMLPRGGEFGEPAERIARGWQIAVALSDGIVAGRPVEVVDGDTANDPAAAVEAALDMMRRQRIDVFAGIIGARVARAMMVFAEVADRPVVLAGAIGETVMSGPCNPRVVRTSFDVGLYQAAAGRFLARKYRTAATLAPDAPGGHTLLGRFLDTYRAAGGRVIEQLWAPTGRRYDWSNWLTRSAGNGPEMIYAMFEGRNAQRLVYRHSRAGLKDRVALVGPEWLFGPRSLNKRGPHAAGLRFLASHSPTATSPANRTFVAAYRAKFDEDPDLYAYLGYENALAVLLTAAETGGEAGDAAAFVAAMKRLDYTGLMPRGPFAFNRSNSAFLTQLHWLQVHYHEETGTRLETLATVPVAADKRACTIQSAEGSR